MKFLFIVGFLFCSTFIFGNGHEHRARVWYPGQNSPPEVIKPPVVLEDADYYEVYDKVSDGALIQKSYRFPVDEPENQLPQSPNNFYFYIVQNFFFGKPINQVAANEEPVDNNNFVGKCRKNKDCKKRGQYCNKGVCTLKPSHPHSHDCKSDFDCKLKLPNRFQNLLPVYCQKGHCKIGQRKPFSPVRPTLPAPVTPEIQHVPTLLPSNKPLPNENKLCNDKLCNGMCLGDVCITAEIVTLAPLPLHYPTCRENKDCKAENQHCHHGVCKLKPLPQQSHDCKVDHDCQLRLPKGFRFLVPVYCDLGHCKLGIRKDQTSKQQLCKHDSECINGGKCQNNRCVAPKPNTPTIATLPLHFPTCSEHRACKNLNHHCHNGVCMPKPHPKPARHCKVDSDCQLHLTPGLLFLIPVYCDKGECNMGIRRENDTVHRKPDSLEFQKCKQNSDCSKGSVCRHRRCKTRFVAPSIPQSPTKQNSSKCKTDSDCIQAVIACGGARYCKNGQCHSRQFSTPLPLLIAATKIPCKNDSGCFAHTILCGISHRCENRKCVSAQSPALPPTKQPVTKSTTLDSLEEVYTTPKIWKCKTDHDCEFLPWVPIYFAYRFCDNGLCKQKPFPTIATTHSTPVTEVALPQTPSHPKHPKLCQKDHDCGYYGPLKIMYYPQHCENGVCKKGRRSIIDTTQQAPVTEIIVPQTSSLLHPKHCQQDQDCMYNGILKIQVYPEYCDNGVCKEGRRPIIGKRPTTTQPPVTEVVVPQTKPSHKKHCQKDSDCAHYGRRPFFLTEHCDNGVCKHGIRPIIVTTEQAPTTEVTVHQETPAHQQHCQKDSDCLNQIEFQHKMLVSVFCHEGHCTLGKSPEIKDTATTVQSSTADDIAVTKKLHFCKSDEECTPFVPHGFTGQCRKHHCIIVPRNPLVLITSVEPAIDLVTVKPLESHATNNPLHEKTCKKDSDCHHSGNHLHHPRVLHHRCVNEKCVAHRRHENTTSDGHTVKPHIVQVPTTINVDVHHDETVKPLESHSTKKPFHRKTCKTDYECRHPGHKVHLREMSCIHGKCVVGPRRHRNTTAQGHTVTAKPHVEQSGSTKNFDVHHDETNVDVHSGETVKPVDPVEVHHTTVTKSQHVKHTTPHVYTCRRNRDCIDYPHPKDMPVYCEHRLCKHGHRRPKNDFDACKSDKDCSEGPCVEGFCTKNPNQHH